MHKLHHERWARGGNGARRGACSIQGLLLLGLAIAAGYWAWMRWAPHDRGVPAEGISIHSADVEASPPSPPALKRGFGGENQTSLNSRSGPPLEPGAKDVVRKMFGEWKRRYLSTERKHYGAASHDLSELLVDLKACGFYTEQALLRALEQGLRELGVPSDQCAEVSKAMLKEATKEGRRPKSGQDSDSSEGKPSNRRP